MTQGGESWLLLVMLCKKSAECDLQSNGAPESSANVVKGHVRSTKLAVEPASGVEVPADHDLLTCFVPYATSMHRRFSFDRDGKTAYERSVWRGGRFFFCRHLTVVNDGMAACWTDTAANWDQIHWKTRAVELGSEPLCCNRTRQSLYLHWSSNSDKCNERHCAESISTSLATQTIALGVPTRWS